MDDQALIQRLLDHPGDLQQILDAFVDGMYICSPDRKISYMNQAMKDLYGPEQLGKHCFSVIYGKDSICDWCQYDQLMDSKEPVQFEVHLPEKNIARRIRSVLIKNNYKLTTYRDISIIEEIRNRGEEELIKSEERFRTIFENAPIMIDSFDSDGKCLLWNKECENQLGYTLEELNAHGNPMELFYPDEKIRKNVIQAIINPDGKFREFEVRSKDGRKKIQQWANFRLNQDFDISVGHDITERRKKEKIQQFILTISELSFQELSLHSFIQKIHQELQKLISAENFYLALYDPTSGLYSFPYHVDQFDSFENLSQLNLENTLTDYVRRTRKGELITAEKEQEIFANDNVNLIGEYSPVWLGAPLFDHLNQLVIGVIAVQDYYNPNAYTQEDLLTLEIIANNIGLFIERIRTNLNLLEAKDRAEESDRLKSAFLANMSHEIRTPMNGILGFAELLEEPDVAPEDQQKYLRIIQKSGQRMLSIINDLIDISKIEAGEMALNPESFHFNHLIHEIHAFFIPESKRKGLDLRISTPWEDSRDLIYTDKTKLNQIFINLIKNSIKYTQKGSIEFGYLDESERLVFFIKDTGKGISEKLQGKLFERFSRDPSETSAQTEGAGLGLSITKGFIELLKGSIWFDSEVGKGTTFYFTLPWDQPPAVIGNHGV